MEIWLDMVRQLEDCPGLLCSEMDFINEISILLELGTELNEYQEARLSLIYEEYLG